MLREFDGKGFRRDENFNGVLAGAAGQIQQGPPVPMIPNQNQASTATALKPKLRTDFPETWIWTSKVTRYFLLRFANKFYQVISSRNPTVSALSKIINNNSFNR